MYSTLIFKNKLRKMMKYYWHWFVEEYNFRDYKANRKQQNVLDPMYCTKDNCKTPFIMYSMIRWTWHEPKCWSYPRTYSPAFIVNLLSIRSYGRLMLVWPFLAFVFTVFHYNNVPLWSFYIMFLQRCHAINWITD